MMSVHLLLEGLSRKRTPRLLDRVLDCRMFGVSSAMGTKGVDVRWFVSWSGCGTVIWFCISVVIVVVAIVIVTIVRVRFGVVIVIVVGLRWLLAVGIRGICFFNVIVFVVIMMINSCSLFCPLFMCQTLVCIENNGTVVNVVIRVVHLIQPDNVTSD